MGEEWKYPAWSCQEIAKKKQNATSGWYWIQFRDGQAPFSVFCDFTTELMGKQNWMRVFHLNMSNPQDQCPPYHFRTVTGDGLRLCGRSSGPGCKSMYPTASGYAYSRVCGSFIGYVYRTPDGFYQGACLNCPISKAYLDGFSITYGYSYYRRHLWSLAMDVIAAAPHCTPPTFVGVNYFCRAPTRHAHNFLYSHDPLFAGQRFCVELPERTTERLEIRICADQELADEDPLLQFAELYVQ